MPGYPCCCLADPNPTDCVSCTSTPDQFSISFSGTSSPTEDCTQAECDEVLATYTLTKNFFPPQGGYCGWGASFTSGIGKIDKGSFGAYTCGDCTDGPFGSAYGLQMRLWIASLTEFRLVLSWGCEGAFIYQDMWNVVISAPFNCETYSDTFSFVSGSNPCGYSGVSVLVEGIPL